MKRTPLARYTALVRGAPLPRPRRPLRPRSLRMARIYQERRLLVAAVLEERPLCEVPWCHSRSTDVHEPLTRARGGSILDPANTRAVCRGCHDEIHTQPGWASELGFLHHSWKAPAGDCQDETDPLQGGIPGLGKAAGLPLPIAEVVSHG